MKHLCNLYVETCQCFLTRLSSSLLFRKCILVPPALSRPAYTCFFFCIIYKTPIMFATRKLHFLWWLRRCQSIRTVCMCPPQLESVRWEAQTLKRSGLFYLKTYLIYTFLSRSAAFNRESFTVSSFLVYKFNESLNLLNVAREGLLDDRKLAGMRCVISLICLPTFTTHPSVYHFSGEFSQHQLSRGF